jgi:hypothetical protein
MSGVTGALFLVAGESETLLLLSPNDGGALIAGTSLGRAESAVGDRRILVAGDMPKVISLIGLPSMDPHESLGMYKAGYRFRLDFSLAKLLRLDLEAKLVGSLAREGQSSLKTVPESLPAKELRREFR